MPLSQAHTLIVKSILCCLLLACLLCVVFLGMRAIGVFCDIEPTRYGEKAKSLRELANDLPFKNPAEDKRKLVESGVQLRNLMAYFPRSGGYATGNLALIKKEIIRQADALKTTEKNAAQAIWRIHIFIVAQVIIFCVAIFHTLLTGRFFAEEDRKKTGDARHVLSEVGLNIGSHTAQHSTSILLTLGIGGTFYGLMVGLGSTDGGHFGIDLPGLFLGLKISFASTLAGVGLSLLVRFVQQALAGPSESIDSLVEKVDQMRSELDKTVKQAVIESTQTLHEATVDTIACCADDMREVSRDIVSVSGDLKSISSSMHSISTKIVSMEHIINEYVGKKDAITHQAILFSELLEKMHEALLNINDACGEMKYAPTKRMRSVNYAMRRFEARLEAIITLLDKGST